MSRLHLGINTCFAVKRWPEPQQWVRIIKAAYSWSQLLHPQESMRVAANNWYERAIDFTAQLGATGMGGHIGHLAFRMQ